MASHQELDTLFLIVSVAVLGLALYHWLRPHGHFRGFIENFAHDTSSVNYPDLPRPYFPTTRATVTPVKPVWDGHEMVLRRSTQAPDTGVYPFPFAGKVRDSNKFPLNRPLERA